MQNMLMPISNGQKTVQRGYDPYSGQKPVQHWYDPYSESSSIDRNRALAMALMNKSLSGPDKDSANPLADALGKAFTGFIAQKRLKSLDSEQNSLNQEYKSGRADDLGNIKQAYTGTPGTPDQPGMDNPGIGPTPSGEALAPSSTPAVKGTPAIKGGSEALAAALLGSPYQDRQDKGLGLMTEFAKNQEKPQDQWVTSPGPRGSLLQRNNRTGETKSVIGTTDTTMQPSMQPWMSATKTADINGGINGEDYLKTLPPNISTQVKALAEGRMQFPSSFALKTPYWQDMISAVSKYDPSFDAVNYNARSKTRSDFTSGKSAVSINALNTVIGHLESLSTASGELNNSKFPAYNSLTNFVASNSGDPRIKKFNTVKKAVVDELTRAYRGTGGSESDIKSWSENIDASNSPEQLNGVIKQMGDLLESKINAMGEQYNQGMGTTKNNIQLVTPQSRAVLDRLEQNATGQRQPTKNAQNTQPSGGLSPQEQAELDQLRKRFSK